MAEGNYRVTVVATMYNSQLNNVLNFTGPVLDPGTLNTLANEVDTIWVDRIKPLQCSAVTYTQIRVQAFGSQVAPFIKTINKAGTQQFDNELDPVQGFVLRYQTATLGRKGRGRSYIAGVMKGWFRNGLVTAEIIQSWNTQIALIMGNTGWGSSPFVPVVTDKNFTVSHPIVAMQVASTLGHQRRRNIGVGI
jgi:hypothetical protein